MVTAVMRGPPKGTFLGGGTADQGEGELKGAARLEGLMGEIAVVAAGDPEEPEPEEAQAEGDLEAAYSGCEGEQAARMDRPVERGRENRLALPKPLDPDLFLRTACFVQKPLLTLLGRLWGRRAMGRPGL